MPRKTLALIILFAVFVILVIVWVKVFTQPQSATDQQQRHTQQAEELQPTAVLYFEPSSLTAIRGEVPDRVSVVLDSGTSTPSTIQLELTFDPKIFTSVQLIPENTTLLGTLNQDVKVFERTIDLEKGTASLLMGITSDNLSAKKGMGKIATFSFLPGFLATSSGTVTFSSRTAVTQLGRASSILKNTTPLQVSFK